MSEYLKFLTAGNSAITVEFGDEINESINEKVRALDLSLKTDPIPGVLSLIPTFRSLMINYDPYRISYRKLLHQLKKRAKNINTIEKRERRIIEIPVCYGGEYGEDIEDVAAHGGLTVEEVIRLHSGRDYRIFMMGFLPGFAYLGGMDERLVTPRLSDPRTKIPAGSVGIGGAQTGIYPVASPGGWRLIGRTPLNAYDGERENPFIYDTGDYIRFIPITEEEYLEIRKQVEAGTYTCKWIGGETS